MLRFAWFAPRIPEGQQSRRAFGKSRLGSAEKRPGPCLLGSTYPSGCCWLAALVLLPEASEQLGLHILI